MHLRPYQIAPVEWLAKTDKALLVAPAGSGKTRMALTALQKFSQPGSSILWLAHTREQVQQAQNAAKEICPELDITYGCYAGMDFDIDHMRQQYDHVICDEAHHLAKTTWGKLIKLIDPKSLWLLTATPFSDDSNGNAFLRSLYTDHYVLDVSEVRDAGGLVQTEVIWVDVPETPGLQDRVDLRIDTKVANMMKWNRRISRETAFQRVAWQENHDFGIVNNAARNLKVIQTFEQCCRIPDSRILILVNFVEHAQILIGLSPELLTEALVHGKTPLKQRREKLAEFVRGDRKVLLGTAALFGEGFDAPKLSHLINSAGGKSPIQIVQRAGRSSRVAEGKSEGIVYDFKDTHLRTLQSHAKARSRIYNSLGYNQTN